MLSHQAIFAVRGVSGGQVRLGDTGHCAVESEVQRTVSPVMVHVERWLDIVSEDAIDAALATVRNAFPKTSQLEAQRQLWVRGGVPIEDLPAALRGEQAATKPEASQDDEAPTAATAVAEDATEELAAPPHLPSPPAAPRPSVTVATQTLLPRCDRKLLSAAAKGDTRKAAIAIRDGADVDCQADTEVWP